MMNLLRSRYSLLLLLTVHLTAQVKSKEVKVPGDPVAQPIAYSHKTHLALGL